MTLQLLFWLLMILWALFGIAPTFPADRANLRPFGGSLLLFAVVACLGWQVFGPVLHR